MTAQAALSKPSIIAMLVVAVMIAGVFIFPLWTISLVAPQYPQGLGLLIHIDRIEGMSPHDLQNINGLNHYIGMHKIEPEGIAELRYMKYFAAGLAVTAGLVAILRRRRLLLAWVIVALALAAVGMYDFYQWEYRYGHELDPAAAIKVPGMSYQPPLFGTRQMLNFQATAWPGLGGLLAMVAVGLGVACVLFEYGRHKCAPAAQSFRVVPRKAAVHGTLLLCAALAATLLPGCTKRPATLAFGTDACELCSMTISDQRYGAVLVTDKGRSYKFDSVECMVAALAPGEELAGARVHSFYVVNYAQPGVMVDATSAAYLVSPAVPSPMGAGVSAFADPTTAGGLQKEKGGEVLDWTAIQDHLRTWADS